MEFFYFFHWIGVIDLWLNLAADITDLTFTLGVLLIFSHTLDDVFCPDGRDDPENYAEGESTQANARFTGGTTKEGIDDADDASQPEHTNGGGTTTGTTITTHSDGWHSQGQNTSLHRLLLPNIFPV